MINTETRKARVIQWKSPSMKVEQQNPFHLHCFPKWKQETRIGQYITGEHTCHNPSRGFACAYCREEI